MKYVISDQNEINIGTESKFHQELAENFKGKVIAAGYCNKDANNQWKVSGESIGFMIKAKPEDEKILNKKTTENKQTLEDLVNLLERKGDIKNYTQYNKFMTTEYSIYDPLFLIKSAEWERIRYEEKKYIALVEAKKVLNNQ